MKYTYFVSFRWLRDNEEDFGSTIINTNKKIKSVEEFKKLEETIKKHATLEDVLVLSLQRLK